MFRACFAANLVFLGLPETHCLHMRCTVREEEILGLSIKMESETKPVCRYGTKCYRNSEKHLKEYSHPTETKKENKKGRPNARTDLKNSAGDDQRKNEEKLNSNRSEQPKTQHAVPPQHEPVSKGKKRLSNSKLNNKTKKIRNDTVTPKGHEDDKDGNTSEDAASDSDVKSNSWTYIKAPAEETTSSSENILEGKSKEEIIKHYYLVDMPPDFYSFYKFCESINGNEPLTVMHQFGLNLVGPFDILAGTKVNVAEKELMLCHWRYFFDPPEFQTIAASDSGYHIGYWRDSPQEPPVFVASNNPNNDCHFKIEGENIFGAVNNYLTDYIKKCDPFSKTKAGKLQSSLQKWAEKEKYVLEKSTPDIKNRQKKVNSKTFHGAGIVVPVQKKTDVGYRPLCETDANIKKICNLIIGADDKAEQDALMEKLQPLITFANIANDECDFGNSLELGIDLFCMGSTVFDSTVEHLLTTAYSLLNRPEFGKIITAHLNMRRKDKNLSVL